MRIRNIEHSPKSWNCEKINRHTRNPGEEVN